MTEKTEKLYKHTCIACRKSWKNKIENPKICHWCRTTLWNTPRKQCRMCGKGFVAYNHRCTFCSEHCTRKWLAIHRVKVNKDPRDCIYCGKPFIPKTNVMKYCSAKCSRKCELEKAHKARELQPKSYSAWYRLRFSIMVRDGFRCQYCGRTAQDAGVKLEVDHILAKNNGGSNNPSNLITCCSDCNIGKSGLFLLTKDGDIPTYLTFKILSNLSSKQTIPKATALQF